MIVRIRQCSRRPLGLGSRIRHNTQEIYCLSTPDETMFLLFRDALGLVAVDPPISYTTRVGKCRSRAVIGSPSPCGPS